VTGYVGMNVGTEDFVGLALEDVSYTVAVAVSIDTFEVFTSAQAEVGFAGLQGLGEDYQIEGENIKVNLNLPSVLGRSIDFVATKEQYDVTVGTEETYELNMDSATIQASGSMTIRLNEFFYTSGTIVFEQSEEEVVLNNGDTITVDALTTGAIDLNGFVGFGYGTEDKMGFEVDNLDFALVVLSDQNSNRSWSSLKASVNNIGFVGFDDFDISGDGVVAINIGANDGSLIDYQAQNLVIQPEGSQDGITFDIAKSNDNLFLLDGNFHFELYDFITIDEHISFTQNFKTVAMDDGSTRAVGYLSFSQSNVDMFAGFNEGTEDAIGLNVVDADFGMAFFVDMTNPSEFWFSAKADIDTVEFVGVDGVSMAVSDFSLYLNTTSLSGRSIDFATQTVTVHDGLGAYALGLDIGSQDEGITFDMQGAMFAFKGTVDLSLYDMIGINGTMAIEASQKEIALSDGSTTVANVFAIAALDVNAFAGFNMSDEDNRLGFSIDDLDFALLVMGDTVDTKRFWVSLESSIGYAGFSGIADVKIGGEDLFLDINQGAYDNTIVDYEAMGGFSVADVGIDVNLDVDRGSHIALGGTFAFNAFNLVTFTEDISFMFNLASVKLSDGTYDSVMYVSAALTDIRVFAGLNDGTDSAVGLEINDIDLGIAISYSVTSFRSWVGIQGTASNIGLLGLDDVAGMNLVDFSADRADISINMPILHETAISYNETPLQLQSLNGGTPMTMDMRGDAGAAATISITNAQLTVLDFVHLKGNMAFSIGGPVDMVVEKTSLLNSLTGGLIGGSSTKSFYYVSMAMSDVDMYVGLNDPYYGIGEKTNALGVYARGVDLGLGIFVEDIVGSLLNTFDPAMLTNLDMSKIDLNNLDSLASALDIDIAELVTSLPIPMLDVVVRAHVDEVSAVGFGDFMSMGLKDINLNVNFGITAPSEGKQIPDFPWINFEKSFPQQDGRPAGFAMATGGEPLYIDASKSILEVNVGSSELLIDDYIYLRGSFGIGFETALKARVTMGVIQSFISSLADNTLFSINDILGDDFDLEATLGLELDSLQLDMFALTFTGTDLYGFAGINGPYKYDSNGDGYIDSDDVVNESALGFAISDVDMGLVLAMPSAVAELGLGGRVWPVFVTGKLDVGEAAFKAGALSDEFSMKVQDVTIDVNSFFLIVVIEVPQVFAVVNGVALAVFQILGSPIIDWTATGRGYTEDVNGNGILDASEDVNNNGVLDDGEDLDGDGVLDLREDINGNGVIDTDGYYLMTGSDQGLFLDYDKEIIGASIGYAELNIGGMLQVTGGISLAKKSTQTVTLSNDASTEVVSLDMSLNNVNGFIGYGEYFQDTNLNGRFDDNDVRNEDAVGLVLDNLNMGITLMWEALVTLDELAQGYYLAAHASVDRVGLVGVDGVSMEAYDMAFDFNAGVRMYLGGEQFEVYDNGMIFIASDILENLPLAPVTVDYSQSTYKDEYGNIQNGYAIGEVDPVVLEATNTLFSLKGGFVLDFYDMLVLNGDVEFTIDADEGISIFTHSTAKAEFGDLKLFELHTLSELVIGWQGIYGSVQVGDPMSGDINLIDNDLMTLGGAFLVQVNATGSTQNLRALELDENNELTGKYTTKEVEAWSLYLDGKLAFEMGSIVNIDGRASLKLSTSGLIGSAAFKMDLQSIGSVNLIGDIAILNTSSEGLVFAMNMETHVDIGLGVINIDADAQVMINTSKTTKYFNVDTGTYLDMYLDGTANILTFKMDFDGKLTFTDEKFELKIDNAEINFFNVLTIDVAGYINSDGEYYFSGGSSMHLGLDISWIKSPSIDIDVDFVLSNDIISASADAQISYYYPKWQKTGSIKIFGVSVPTYGFVNTKGSISLSADLDISYYDVNLTTAILGKDYTLNWTFGDAPQIATKVNDTLYLNMGDRASQRGSNGAFDDFTNEDYEIWENDGVVYVKSFGVTSAYRGINVIVGNAGSGNDKITVASSVTKKLLLTGGDGNDTFVINGGSSDSVVYGNDGDDIFINTVANIKYYGGEGDDTFEGSDVAEYIDMGIGKNIVNAYGGNDTIYDAGMSTIDAGSGDDIVTIQEIKALDIIFGDGDDTLVLQDSDATQTYSLAQNSISYALVDIDLSSYNDIENVVIDAQDSELIVQTSDTHSFDGINLGIKSTNSVDLSDADFDIANGTLSISANGIIGTIKGKIASLNVENKSSNENKDVNIDLAQLVVDTAITSVGSVNISANSIAMANAKVFSQENITIKTDSLSVDNSVIDGWKDMGISSLTKSNVAIGSSATNSSDFNVDLSIFGTSFTSYTVGDSTKNVVISSMSSTKETNFVANNITISQDSIINLDNGSLQASSIDILGSMNIDDLAISAGVLNISSTINSTQKGSKVLIDADTINIAQNSTITLSNSATLNINTNDATIDGTLDIDGSANISSTDVVKVNGNIYAKDIDIEAVNNIDISTILGTDRNGDIDTTISSITLTSTSADVNINSDGTIKTSANLLLSGVNVNIDGAVESTRVTAPTTDEEVTFIVGEGLNINGTFSLDGSLKIESISDLVIGGSGIDMSASSDQHLKLYSDGNIIIEDNTSIITDKLLDIYAKGAITTGSGSLLSSDTVVVNSLQSVVINGDIIANEEIRVGSNATLTIANSATLTAGEVVHIKADNLTLNGTLNTTETTSIILINGGSSAIINGSVVSSDIIEMNIGVDATQSFDNLEGRISIKRLDSESVLTVSDSTSLSATNDVVVQYGGSIEGVSEDVIDSYRYNVDSYFTVEYHLRDTDEIADIESMYQDIFTIHSQELLDDLQMPSSDVYYGDYTLEQKAKLTMLLEVDMVFVMQDSTKSISGYATSNNQSLDIDVDTVLGSDYTKQSVTVPLEGIIYIKAPNLDAYDSLVFITEDGDLSNIDIFTGSLSFQQDIVGVDYTSFISGGSVTMIDKLSSVAPDVEVEVPTVGSFDINPGSLSSASSGSNVVLGGEDTGIAITIGDANTPDAQINLNVSLEINNTGDGGEVTLSNKLILEDGASLSIKGSGHTTMLSNDITVTEDGEIAILDSIKVDGSLLTDDNTVTLTAEYYDITLGEVATDSLTYMLQGNSDGTDDLLSVVTDANVIVNAQIGSTTDGSIDNIEGMSIDAVDVTFNESVTIDGDLVIDASGDIEFDKAVTITGDLIITNATSVSFLDSVTVTGTISIQSDEIDISGNMSGDTLVVMTTTAGKEIHLGDSSDEMALNLTESDISYIQSTFNSIKIGQATDTNATSSLSNVVFGSSSDGLFNSSVNIYANEISFEDSLVADNDMSLNSYGDITIDGSLNSSADISIYSVAGGLSQDSSDTFGADEMSIDVATGVDTKALSATSIDVTNRTSGDMTLAFDSTVSIDSITQSANGTISITSSSDININTDMTSTKQTEIISTGGSVTIGSDYSIDTGSEDLTISANDDISVSSITTSSGTITLSTTSGDLLDNLATEDANITSSSSVVFNISGDIGASGDFINTNIDTFSSKSLKNIYLENSKALIVGNLSATDSINLKSTSDITQNDNTKIEVTNGSITLDAVSTINLEKLKASTSVDITANVLSYDSININNALSHIESDTLNVDILNNIGSSTNYLKTDVNSADVSSGAGGVYLANLSDLSVGAISGTVVSLSVDGAITDGNSDTTNFSATTLTVSADSFGSSDDVIETEVATLSLQGDFSSICVSDIDDLALSTSSGDIEIDGDISIKADNLSLSMALDANNITLDIADTLSISGIDANSVTLKNIQTLSMASDTTISTGELVLDGLSSFGSSVSHYDVNIESLTLENGTANVYIDNNRDININAFSDTTSGTVYVNAGSNDVYIIGDISTSQAIKMYGANITSDNAITTTSTAYMSATDDMTLNEDITSTGSVTLKANSGILSVSKVETSGNISIVSSDSIVDLNGDNLNFVGGVLNANVTNSLGTNSDLIETNIDSLTIGANVTSIAIDETDTITLPSMSTITGDMVLKASSITIDNAIDIDGKLLLEAKESGDFNINSTVSANMVSLTTAGTININSAITTDSHLYVESTASTLNIDANLNVGGSMSLKGYSGVNQNVNLATTAEGATIAISSENGAFVMADDLSITSSSIGIITEGNIKYDTLTATNGIILDSTSGTIKSYNSISNITADSLILKATSVGESTNYINTDVANLAINASSGSVYLKEADSVDFNSVNVKVNAVEKEIQTESIAYDESEIFGVISGGSIVLDISNGDITSIEDSSIMAQSGTLDLDSMSADLEGFVSASGDVDFYARGSLSMSDSLISGNGNLTLKTDGETSVGLVQSNDTINITLLSEDDIIDNNGDDINFRATSVVLDFSGSLGESSNAIETEITNISFSQNIDSLYIDELDTMTFPDLSKVENNIHIAQSQMTISQDILRGANTVYLEAKEGALVINDNIRVVADTLTLKSQENIGTSDTAMNIEANTLSLSSAKDAYITSENSIILKDISVDNLYFESSSDVTLDGSMSGTTSLNIISANIVSTKNSTISDTQDVVLKAQSMSLSNIDATTLNATTTNKDITINGTLSISDALIFSSANDIIINSSNAFGSTTDEAQTDDSITLNSIDATTLSATTKNGDITIDGTLNISDTLNLNSANAIIMSTNSAVTNTNKVTLTATTLTMDTSSIIDGVNTLVIEATDITASNIDADDISITADTYTQTGTLNSTNDLVIEATDSISMQSGSKIVGENDVTLKAPNTITLATIEANNIRVESTKGSIAQDGSISATESIVFITAKDLSVNTISADSISITTNGNINQLGTITSQNNLTLEATKGITMSSGSKTVVNGDVNYIATQDITISSIEAVNVSISTDTNINQSGSIISTGSIEFVAGGLVVLADTSVTKATNSITLDTGDDVNVGALDADTIIINSGGDINQAISLVSTNVEYSAKGSIAVSSISADTITLDATYSITQSGTLDANTVDIDAGTNATIANISADTINVTAGGDITQTGDIEASDSVRVKSTNGSITMQDGTSTKATTVIYNAKEDINISYIESNLVELLSINGFLLDTQVDLETDIVATGINLIGKGAIATSNNLTDASIIEAQKEALDITADEVFTSFSDYTDTVSYNMSGEHIAGIGYGDTSWNLQYTNTKEYKHLTTQISVDSTKDNSMSVAKWQPMLDINQANITARIAEIFANNIETTQTATTQTLVDDIVAQNIASIANQIISIEQSGAIGSVASSDILDSYGATTDFGQLDIMAVDSTQFMVDVMFSSSSSMSANNMMFGSDSSGGFDDEYEYWTESLSV
jgi:hypothetical protein